MTLEQASIKRGRGRPPKTDNSKRDTRERLLRCGIELLTGKGFASIGIDAVLKAEGIPKGSFYHYFASKEAFVEQVISGYGDYFAAKLDRWLLNQQRTPLERLHDFVADGRQGLLRFAFKRGCLVGNLGQEVAPSHPQLRDQLEGVFIDWQQRVARCLQEAQEAGQISHDIDCQAWSEFFWIGWEGAILRAKLSQSLAPIDLFAELFFAGLTQPAQTEQLTGEQL